MKKNHLARDINRLLNHEKRNHLTMDIRYKINDEKNLAKTNQEKSSQKEKSKNFPPYLIQRAKIILHLHKDPGDHTYSP